MLNKNVLLLGTLAALSACSTYSGSGPRYVPRPNIPVRNYTAANFMEDHSDRKAYNAYEQREQCQHYRRIPRNSVELSNCVVIKAPLHQARVTRTHTGAIFHSYTIYFNFDRSGIRPDQQATLDQIVREIETYKPADVTVTGYADRSGKVSYNQKLSKRRANTVSKALTALGVTNEEIDEHARGEFDNAVPTPDGVKLQENRRVVIDFRR